MNTTKDPEKLEWIRSALLTFHKKHYRPDNMTVVLAGPQSLDTLQEWLVSRYSQIPTIPATNGTTDGTTDTTTTTTTTDTPAATDIPAAAAAAAPSKDIQDLINQAAAEAPPNTPDHLLHPIVLPLHPPNKMVTGRFS